MTRKEIVLISVIIAIIVVSPLISTLPKVSTMKGQYIPKWYEISPMERQKLLEKTIGFNVTLSNYLKILLEISAVIIVLLVIVEYVKFYKLYKKE